MSRVLPMLFNTDMVQAILDERKTVTRRKVKPKQLIGLGCDRCPNNMPEEYIKEKKYLFKPYCDMPDDELIGAIYKPPCEPGDILFVQEEWAYDNFQIRYLADEYVDYLDKYNCLFINKDTWNSASSMPLAVARIWLRVIDVKVERLQDMTLDDFLSEGVCLNPEAFNDPENASGQAKNTFSELWDSTLKKSDRNLYGWDANPWVWVIDFERCEKSESEGLG